MIIAVDIRKNPLQDGPDEQIFTLLTTLKIHGIPYVFSGKRNELGLALYGREMRKKVKSACIAIFNYEAFTQVN